eukprot:1181668-Prorocentrum_minimum.AAC.1
MIVLRCRDLDPGDDRSSPGADDRGGPNHLARRHLHHHRERASRRLHRRNDPGSYPGDPGRKARGRRFAQGPCSERAEPPPRPEGDHHARGERRGAGFPVTLPTCNNPTPITAYESLYK